MSWQEDRNKRSWATAGIRMEIKRLRHMAKFARKRFAKNDIWGDPAYWTANAYDNAADRLEISIRDLEAGR